MDLGCAEEEDEDIEVKDGEEVNQIEFPAPVPTIAPIVEVSDAEPILVPSLDSEAVDNLDFPVVQLAAKDIVEHSFNQGGSLGSSLGEVEEVMAPRQRVLGKKKAMEDEVVKMSSSPVSALPNQAKDQFVAHHPSRSGKGKGSIKGRGLPIKRRGRVLASRLSLPSFGLHHSL